MDKCMRDLIGMLPAKPGANVYQKKDVYMKVVSRYSADDEEFGHNYLRVEYIDKNHKKQKHIIIDINYYLDFFGNFDYVVNVTKNGKRLSEFDIEKIMSTRISRI